MEPLDSKFLTLPTDVMNTGNTKCRIPSPATSYAGSDCGISASKVVSAAEAAVEERNDVMLRLMDHLIPDSTELEEGSATETDGSIASSPSTLKRRLHNLAPSSEAVKLADRVATLNRRSRRERDLYLHLQGVTNRIEEKDETDLSLTDSSRTGKSALHRHRQGQTSNPRARRRERLNSLLLMSQHEISSDLQLCSPSASSPEPLTLREFDQDLTKKMDQPSPPIRDQYSLEKDSMLDPMREKIGAGLSNSSITQQFRSADEMLSSLQNASQFSSDQNFCTVANDGENSTTVIDAQSRDHERISNNDFDDVNYFKGSLTDCNFSPEAEDARVQVQTSSTACATGLDYAYVTRKRTPMKFGGYRPAPELIFRNLSSDSESDAPLDRIIHKRFHGKNFRRGDKADLENHDAEKQELRDSDFILGNPCPNSCRRIEVEAFSNQKIEDLKEKLVSPAPATDRKLAFEESEVNQRLEECLELQNPAGTDWALISQNEKNRYVSNNVGNVVEHNTSVDGTADSFDNVHIIEERFSNLFNIEKDTHDLRNSSSENFLKPGHENHVSLTKNEMKNTSPSLPSNGQGLYDNGSSRDAQTLISRSPEDVKTSEPKSSVEVPGNTNHQPVPASVRPLSESMENPENLRNLNKNSNCEHSFLDQEAVTIENNDHLQSDIFVGRSVRPKIPPLEIESNGCSQSHSLSSENKNETARSSLDVNALIQALSDVSLKQEISNSLTNKSTVKMKSPSGYGHRFSGSSGPRSSEYTPAAGGSRQSLTSLEVSEAHSVQISNDKAETTVRRQATPFLTSNEQSARSTLRTLEVFKNESRTMSNSKKSPIVGSMHGENVSLEIDFPRGSSFIPVVAKVNRTNLVCPKHPLKIKSIGKLISPRKYPNTDCGEEIGKPLTSRTDISQSSEGSRKSFRSLKSVQLIHEVGGKKIEGLGPKTESTRLQAPLSGRRVLEPLDSAPKIQQDLLTSLNRKFEHRKKTAENLSEIINSQSETTRERITTPKSSRKSSRRSPLSQTNRTDSCSTRHMENPVVQPKYSTIHHSRVSSSRKTPGEPFNSTSRPSTKENPKLLKHSMEGKDPGIEREKSSGTSGNALRLLSKRLIMSSGDYEGKISSSPSPRDEGFTGNDESYNWENKLSETLRISNVSANSLARSLKNCMHLNDLQDGREVTLLCGNSQCQEDSLREKNLFEHLPDEISASLTRHASFGTQVAANLNSSRETPSTIEDLRKNIQENNDQWIKDFKSEDDLGNAVSGSVDAKMSSISSPVQFRDFQSQKLLLNPTNIPQKVPLVNFDCYRSQLPLEKPFETGESSCFESCVSSKIDLDSSECSSPLHAHIRGRSEDNNSQPWQLDSQRSSARHSGLNSCENTHRSIDEFTDFSRGVSSRHFVETMPSAIGLERSFEEEEALNAKGDIISSTGKQTNSWKNSRRASFSVHPFNYTSDTDEHDHRIALNLSTDDKSVPDEDVGTVKSTLSKTEEFENCVADTVPNPQLEYSQSHLEKLGHSEKDCDQKNQFANELQDHETQNRASINGPNDQYAVKSSNTGFAICEKKGSLSSTRSAKSQGMTQHNQDVNVSSPVSIKSFLSMSKLNSSVDSKWDVTTVAGTSSVKQSQDRFPFTISESASRKTSKYKDVTDMSFEQILQDQNSHVEHNDVVSPQQLIQEKSGDQGMVMTNAVDVEDKLNLCEESSTRQLRPFLEELGNKITNDSPGKWQPEIPFLGSNYISYGFREEPRTLLPTVKDIVKKISAKLRHPKTKRCHDPEEAMVEILYRNKQCRCESTEGSSSATSLYQSQFLNTGNKLLPGLIKRSNDGSRASSGKTVKLRRNVRCISMSMQQSPKKGCDRNDLWIQEFDSDVEFDGQESAVAYHKMLDSPKTEIIMPRTSSPVNNRYSVFFARRKLSGIIDEAHHNEQIKMDSVSNHSDRVHNEKGNCNCPNDAYELFTETQESVSKFPRTPANSSNDNIDELDTDTKGGSFGDSTQKSGCCCFRIYRILTAYKNRGSKPTQRIKVSRNK